MLGLTNVQINILVFSALLVLVQVAQALLSADDCKLRDDKYVWLMCVAVEHYFHAMPFVGSG